MERYARMRASAAAALCAAILVGSTGCTWRRVRDKIDAPFKGTEKAVATHIKNLKSGDPEVRKVSAQMLGQLGNPAAVVPLIEALKDNDIWVQLYAHGSLVRITGRSFGYKNYREWRRWWDEEGDEFMKKYERGFSATKEERARMQNTLGLNALRSGNPRGAQYYFTDAISQDPRIPDYHNNLGLAYLHQGRFLDAYDSFHVAISIAPELVHPYMNVGQVYEAMGKRPEAEAWYRKAVGMDRDESTWQPLWRLGRHRLLKRDYQGAIDALEACRKRVAKLNVREPALHRDLALAYYGMEQIFSAWEEVKTLRDMGFDLNSDFVNKLKDELRKNGFDPDSGERPKDLKAIPERGPDEISP